MRPIPFLCTCLLVPAILSPPLTAQNPGDALEKKHVTVYYEPGRFGGWPANHGLWAWGNEILVGFSRGYYKDLGPERHNIDREKPEEHWLARSKDGGETWQWEDPSRGGVLMARGQALHGTVPAGILKEPVPLEKPIDFLHPDLALTFRMLHVDTGPSLLYYSYDRGRTWSGPFRLKVGEMTRIAARTDYQVLDRNSCLVFLTAAKSNNREGRVFCAKTSDGGRTWNFVSWIGPEPKGIDIMPASVRLSPGEFLVTSRRQEESRRWIDAYRSADNGKSWTFLNTAVSDTGEGNPPSLIRLRDGRLCLTYGFRAMPYGICARLSSDGGNSWGAPIVLRNDGGGRDLGYVRSVQRPDGKVVTIYYFLDRQKPERYIAATIWDPSPAR